MRFDFKPGNASACKNPPCAPSTNVIKDVVKQAGNCSWSSYDQATLAQITSGGDASEVLSEQRHEFAVRQDPVPKTMGHPRDLCHYFQDSSGNYPLCTSWVASATERGIGTLILMPIIRA